MQSSSTSDNSSDLSFYSSIRETEVQIFLWGKKT
jgi:hypothetical protein